MMTANEKFLLRMVDTRKKDRTPGESLMLNLFGMDDSNIEIDAQKMQAKVSIDLNGQEGLEQMLENYRKVFRKFTSKSETKSGSLYLTYNLKKPTITPPKTVVRTNQREPAKST